MEDSLEAQWETVKACPDSCKRAEYLKYCSAVLAAVEQSEISEERGAFLICGAGGQFIDHLQPTDQAIITLAGQLELPKAHQRADVSWDQLVQLIRATE